MLLKSTYKILSAHLDGLPLAKGIFIRNWSSSDENLFDLDAEYNLYDYPHCRRSVSGIALLSANLPAISRKIDQLKILEDVIIKVDYCSQLTVANRLFLKRIFQAIGQLQIWHSDITFTLAAENVALDKIKALSAQISGEK